MNTTVRMLVKTENISSSLRNVHGGDMCGERLYQARGGRRVLSEYMTQRWRATVTTSDQLCSWRWKSGRRVPQDNMVLFRIRDSGGLACKACTAHAV